MLVDWIKSFFGKGYIYADVVCEDGTRGRVRAPYVGDPSTLDVVEYIQQVKIEGSFKTGKKIVRVMNVRID